MAYAQWIVITNENVSTEAGTVVIIKNVVLKWGKFYKNGTAYLIPRLARPIHLIVLK